jgi:hypothetical protein
MVEPLLDKLVRLLAEALVDTENCKDRIAEFQRLVWDCEGPIGSPTIDAVLSDLAMDLDYYEPNPTWRSEDPSYYGEKRLKLEIEQALDKLRREGVHAPSESD